MEYKLYAANLAESVTHEQLRELLSTAGTVIDVQAAIHPKSQKPTGGAMITLESDTPLEDVLSQFNGLEIDGKRLALSPAVPSFPLPRITPEQEALAKEIAEKLEEKESAPCRQILRVVRICGMGFARTILEEALKLEEAGGLMVLDGSRRRTKGGVFFYVGRGRMTYEVQGAIFPRGKRRRLEQRAMEQAEERELRKARGEKKGKGKGPQQKKNGRAKAKPPRQAPAASTEPGGEEVTAAPPVDLDALRSRLDALRQAHRQAQEDLTALQANKGAKSVGTFSAIKQVFELQRQIDELLKSYPQLK